MKTNGNEIAAKKEEISKKFSLVSSSTGVDVSLTALAFLLKECLNTRQIPTIHSNGKIRITQKFRQIVSAIFSIDNEFIKNPLF